MLVDWLKYGCMLPIGFNLESIGELNSLPKERRSNFCFVLFCFFFVAVAFKKKRKINV
jgi:hypothetical protein